jgi:hypothetical protein
MPFVLCEKCYEKMKEQVYLSSKPVYGKCILCAYLGYGVVVVEPKNMLAFEILKKAVAL